MRSNKNIFIDIMIHNLIIAFFPILLLITVLCGSVCITYRNSEIAGLQKEVDLYSKSITDKVSATISKSGYILKYSYLSYNLDKTFESADKTLEYIDNITTYLDTIFTENNLDNVALYFSNPTMVESRYTLRIERLSNFDEIMDYFENNNSSYYMSPELCSDSMGNMFFTIYRRMPLNKNSLLACKAYIPMPENNIQITKADDFASGGHVFSEAYGYCFSIPVNTLNLPSAYFKIICWFLIFTVLLFAVIIFVSHKATKNITGNITTFIKDLSEKSVYSVDTSDTADDSHELLVIKKAIGSLVTKTQKDAKKQYKYILEKRKLELELLQSKLDPHLLYNSLSMIKLSAYTNNDRSNESIIEIVNCMVAYYRQILNKGKQIVTVSEECELTRRYLRLHELSHGKKYTLNINIPDDIMQMQTIHLLFQPFVENSLYHGFLIKRNEYTIDINCEKHDGYIVFSIRDNGCGLSAETLYKLNNLNLSSGYGVKNTAGRITLAYGKNSSVYYESQENKYTTVHIKIYEKPNIL